MTAVQKKKKLGNATLENVRLLFPNFAGRAGKFNAEGSRNFAIALDPATAEAMIQDGWNVKFLKARDDQEEEQAYITVKVNFNGRPPRIFMVTSRNKTQLDDGTAEILDWSPLLKSDVTISAYHYDVNGKTGITAYLVSIYATIEEDYLDLKYAEIPDSREGTPGMLEIEEPMIEGEVIEDAEIDESFEPLEIGKA